MYKDFWLRWLWEPRRFLNAPTITLDNINQLNKSGCKYELIKVPAGSQSLDMHLISFVGYAIGLGGEKYNYIVISKDKDYDNVISFWKSKCGISIKRQAAINVSSVKNAIPNIDTSIDNQNNPVQELPQTIQSQIRVKSCSDPVHKKGSYSANT